MANGLELHWKHAMYLDRPGVIAKVGKWKASILARTGGLGLTIMRRQIRPAKKDRKARTVVVSRPRTVTWRGRTRTITQSVTCYADPSGMVIDTATGIPVDRVTATAAREIVGRRLRGRGEGRPPRSRTGKLKKFMEFRLDPQAESVVIGAIPFPVQPQMVGAVSVPQLLNYGGGEVVGGALARYGARPFVEPSLPPTFQKMKNEILKRPIR